MQQLWDCFRHFVLEDSMKNFRHLRSLTHGLSAATVALAITLTLTLAATPAAQAQSFKVIYSFSGATGASNPWGGVTLDAAGNLYGTTSGQAYGGGAGNGAVYKLTHKNGTWVFTPLYTFAGGNDGNDPEAGIVFGPGGSLYGTTIYGGGSTNCPYGCGTVFKLQPQAAACKTALCPWKETVLYRFQGGSDGSCPGWGNLVFDQSGAIYDTAGEGGNTCTVGWGVVYKLTPSGQSYTQSVLYRFTGGQDGGYPFGAVVFDKAGNLYTPATGTTGVPATVIELTPSGGGWSETTLHQFNPGSDGWYPVNAPIFDSSGNLYGGAPAYGPSGGGTVYELMPSGGSWNFSVVQSFAGAQGPWGGLAMDAAGNIYGTTGADGLYGYGNVFELTPSGGSFTYKDLYDFTGGSDGRNPAGTVTLDSNGNLYGTAWLGGNHGTDCRPEGCGVIWEITP
jgi:uncharacterized repeat protein (TIGR03803 family)